MVTMVTSSFHKAAPILAETHEDSKVTLYDVRRCCDKVNELDLA